ncbi:HD domain-containing protein [Actinomadura madurae]|uniref:HD domain-containing protein n=1 Tax=Actinomadura madurae TaxID=1993 RepID=UPI00202682FF|nr:HD domain-containing protein [Actinomadura madurae]MCP9967359.1 HD domain-containing protein [Actinomadura madurae]MCP9979822.1 HD domain-containing protein [Actinomadura madurae]MCQ0008649.1 HD domain-containing protein [Actinomadura madurae]MCQ0016025.1 HD domain-containing protein [Actinomadura madurae]URM96124.1 HD domain-containing protein [Actinomadura madurae]
MELFTRWHAWETARADIAASGADIGLDGLDKAVAAAERWHGDQRRPTGAPYVEHLLEALEVLVRGAGVTAPAVLSAAILHDAVEDTPATLADVEAGFGPEVTELVDWVTKPPATGTGRQAKRAARAAYLRRLNDAPREAVLVKLADRASNVQTLDRMPPDFQRRYYAETITYIIPLAEDEPWFRDWYSSWRRRFAHLQ